MLSYWLSLSSFIALVVLGGGFFRFVHKQMEEYTLNKKSPMASVHPFLRHEKIPVHEAKVADIAFVDGISYKKASRIYEFFQSNKDASLTDVLKVSGIGKKTLEKLLVWFY